MKKWMIALTAGMLLGLAACGGGVRQPGSSWDVSENHSGAGGAPKPVPQPSIQPESVPAADTGETGRDAPKVLIACFSRSGNTLQIASWIEERVGGDLFRIETERAYPTDYDAVLEEARREQRENARPALSASVEDMEQYDVVFVGYPIWFGDTPMVVLSFLESYDFSGKTVVPFCTSGGSAPQTSYASVRRTVPDAAVAEGFWVRGSEAGAAQRDCDAWIDGLRIFGSP